MSERFRSLSIVVVLLGYLGEFLSPRILGVDVVLSFERKLVFLLCAGVLFVCWSLAALWFRVLASVALCLLSELSEFLRMIDRAGLVECKLDLFFVRVVSVLIFLFGGWGLGAALAASGLLFAPCPWISFRRESGTKGSPCRLLLAFPGTIGRGSVSVLKVLL